ncbi:hypothetical protein [Azospirillum thermophilum]|uniref:Uncharacterized protein n=1 Tax=Azospirillum thermophilum TaxID=2202148 RepID=A0A2S2CKJ3_9PROT|nr:hypothetical protein [Azospirillum thermophilum]AWK85023.1 hypothetical protein DEW08_01455 [Azospirillum thermophilum]
MSEVLQGILTDGTTKWADGGNPVIAQNIQKALQASIGLPVEQLVANLQLAATDFRTAFDQVGKAQPDQVAAAVASVAQSFVAARDRARQLGLAIDGYARARSGRPAG